MSIARMSHITRLSKVVPQVGDELGEIHWTTDLDNWNRFSAVNGYFTDFHMDPEAGKAAGFEGAIGMGSLHCSYLHTLVRAWSDGADCIRRMTCRYLRENPQGITIVASGRVSSVVASDEITTIELELWIQRSDTKSVLTVGQAVIERMTR